MGDPPRIVRVDMRRRVCNPDVPDAYKRRVLDHQLVNGCGMGNFSRVSHSHIHERSFMVYRGFCNFLYYRFDPAHTAKNLTEISQKEGILS